MLNYNFTSHKRKNLVYTLSRILGEPSRYLGMPTCGFRIGIYTISKYGEVTPTPEPAVIEALARHGYCAEKIEPAKIITFPRPSEHTLQNFDNMINSKRSLIRHALQLKNTLPYDVTEKALIIRWFENEQPDNMEAALILISAMLAQARRATRVSPKPVWSNNPKYSFRVFLNSLGMIGNDYKETRRELLKHLEGCAANKHLSCTSEMPCHQGRSAHTHE